MRALCSLRLRRSRRKRDGGAVRPKPRGCGARERFWPQWRGPYATGVSRHANPPTEWSETKNIRWKVEIPGRGSSSPVIWGDRLFVLSAVPIGVAGAAAARAARRHPAARRASLRRAGRRSPHRQDDLGAHRDAKQQPHEATHQENGTYASSSAITDGQRVYAWFESQGMYVYDMDGTLLWSKDLGDKTMRNQFGEGSTPVLAGDRLVIVWDHLGGIVHRGAGRHERTRAVAPVARRDRHLGDAARRRAGRPQAGDRAREEQDPQLRPRDRRDRLGEQGHDDEPDSVAGVRRRDGVRDQRIPGEQPQGDPPGERQGRHHRHRRRSSGRSIATRRTCRRRCSTTASSIC